MMYRPTLGMKDRGGAIVAVAAIHAALLFAFLHLSGRVDLTNPQEVLQTFDILDRRPPPPPPPPPPPQRNDSAKPKEKEGGSSPKNIKSEATEVVAPKPQILLPPRPQVAVTETPRQGAAPTQGASDVRGPGTGSGGVGTGTGSGMGGNGTGGGGAGGIAVRARLITPDLRGRDFPPDLLRSWPRGAPLFVRFQIASNGYMLKCIVDRGTGIPTIDGHFCDIARARMRFRPALDRSGRPVDGWIGYVQEPAR